MGSFTAVLKRTMDSAPTMPMDSATLEPMAITTGEVTRVSRMSVVENEGLYSTPR